MDPREELQRLEDKLRTTRGKFTQEDYSRFYELTGLVLGREHGVSATHNPCSIPAITSTVLKMAEFIKPCRILNVGIGGYPLIDIELCNRGFGVVGIEYAFSLASLAKKSSEAASAGINVIAGDGQCLPFKDASFDACICSETVEHIPNDRLVMSEIFRVLKPGGKVLMTVPSLWQIVGAGSRLKSFFKTGSWVDHPGHLREYDSQSAKKMIRGLFEIERTFPVPFTVQNFRKQPYEKMLSWLVSIPGLRGFSISLAYLLKKAG